MRRRRSRSDSRKSAIEGRANGMPSLAALTRAAFELVGVGQVVVVAQAARASKPCVLHSQPSDAAIVPAEAAGVSRAIPRGT
jgi:hypothetical protein